MNPGPETAIVKAALVDNTLPILNAEFTGSVGYWDFLRDCAWRMAAYPDVTGVLTDLSQVTAFTIAPAEMHALAAWTANHSPLLRRAIVAPEPAQYGVGRMYQILCEVGFDLKHIQVFQHRTDALQWLKAEVGRGARN
jgi:hypothetical protein